MSDRNAQDQDASEISLRVQALLDKDEICTVILDLARATDRLDEALMASCYHEDGFDDHGAFSGSGRDFARWVVNTLPIFAATHHFIGQPRIRLDGETANCDTYCIAHHLSEPDAEGRQTDVITALRYVDRFERRHGLWKIAKRVCAFDWTQTLADSADAKFVFGNQFTLGRRDRTDLSYEGP